MKQRIFRGRVLTWDTFPVLMGILNVTPDSFSDGNSLLPLEERITRLLEDGARIIDIGGESTRPGAQEVPADEEIRRILPAVRAVRKLSPDVFISIDTRKAAPARAALEEGADLINDVSGFHFDPALPRTAAEYHAGIILMHMRSVPADMQSGKNLLYPDGLLPTVRKELLASVKIALDAGMDPEGIVLDPGIGFAKNAEQCLAVIRGGEFLREAGYPLLSGPSRKSFLGTITGETDPEKRDAATCGACLASVLHGYEFLRVHNVRAVRDALRVFLKTETEREN